MQPSISGKAPAVPWYKEPTATQWQVLVATSLGWILDAFDFTLLLLVLGDIGKTFGVDLVAMSSIITITLFCRLLGGIFVGTWADKVGRRAPMMISILGYSVFSFASGLAPDYGWFLVLRMIFGVAMGGEYAAGTPLAMESWPQRSRGLASGLLQGGWPIGYLLATVVYYLVFPVFGWRALFFIGGLPALLVLWIRSSIPESPVWRERREKLEKTGRSDELSLIRLFKPGVLGITIHTTLVMGGVMFSYYSISSLWPTFLTNVLKLDVAAKSQFVILFNAASLLGYWSCGVLSEVVGRRWTVAIFAAIGAVTLPLYSMVTDPTLVMIGGMVEGFVGVGFWGVIPAYLTERFPTAVRGVGPGAVFHAGAAIGSTAPTILAIFIQAGTLTMGQAIAAGAFVALVFLVCMIFLAPESKGTVFTADA